MTTDKTNTRILKDFQGRRLTACAIIVAALGSASLNVYGASQIFPNPVTSWIFGIVIGAGEVIAVLALRHIVTDWDNNRFWKAKVAAVTLALAITGCVFSGHRAFHTLFLEAEAKHEALSIRAERLQAEADAKHGIMLTGEDTSSTPKSRWERAQRDADEARLEVLKAAPPPEAFIYILLALFELIKIGGLWSLATPTKKGLTQAQRRAQQRQAKLREIRAQAAFEKQLEEAEEFPPLKVVENA